MEAKQHHSHASHEAKASHESGGRGDGSKRGPSADGHSGHGQSHGGHSHHDHHAMMAADFRTRFFVSALATVPILLLSPMLQQWAGLEGWRFEGDLWLLLGCSTFVYLYGGLPFLRGLVEELSSRRPGMMTLVAIAISTAYLYSAAVALGLEGKMFFWETATLVDLMLLGHWIEMRSVMGAGRALEELAKLMPSEAHRLAEDGSAEDVPVEELRPGDRIRVKPGETIPADGVVIEGRSSVDESMLTGESKPVRKEAEAQVVAGSANGSGSLTVEVSKTGEDSYLNQVVNLVREAEQSKSRTQNLADRAAMWLTVIGLSSGAATFLVWKLIVQQDLAFSLERAVTVMVITCPHALGLAIPLVVAASTSLGASKGLLIRDRAAFERAKDLDVVVFDKTGTLTEGRFGVSDVRALADLSEDETLRLAAAVEAHSEHPIAQGVLRTAQEKELSIPEASDFEAIAGKGVRAMVEGREIRVLSPKAFGEEGSAAKDEEELAGQGKTLAYVLRDGEPVGLLALADVVRPESKEAVRTLRDRGVRVVMLTGDNRRTAEWVGREVGVDEVIAEVLPDQKGAKIRELQGEGRIVAMTGDGVNDAPALATADLGIAIGAGTDVAVGTADVVLVRSDPRDVAQAALLAKATYRKMVQNLWYAAGYNIVAIPLAAGALAGIGVVLSPAVGAVLMSLSTVVVAINARFLKI
ncbi:MAG: heavy metal translocating P-type ATPase [Acidobacteria bacterium]|nr:heavy metal translocating P-type ATPase [Acidobacteriota bacterium]